MNFSEIKKDNLTKKCHVRAFKVNSDNTNVLYNQIEKSGKFKPGVVIKINDKEHLKLKDFTTKDGCHYLYLSIYNPKDQVSITPSTPNKKDLLDIDNLDNLHAFMIVKENSIISLMLISTNWSESKLAKIFAQFDINIKPAAILRKTVIQRIKTDGFRALHVNMVVDESDFVKAPGFFQSLINKEPTVKEKGIVGHLTIDASGNSEIANSIEQNTAIWVDDLDSDFYLETKKGEKIKGDDLRLTKEYFTVPYGSKSISSKYAKEMLEHFVANEL
ncbi:hypothetical protein [Leminorella grimontii]|uniref:hypothetical protein n=1 Tax=Leminorella grimontii TaxID=82981 RepID=UPI00208C0988|nr:hypothetical protein [Leminorella grimontii]GKX58361.1 hypothetical protein SOASR031_06760 [Leminorella grimontii]